MCELLIMAGSRTSTDPMIDPKLFKAGDVLLARADGWPWGSDEISNPLFMIIRVPDLPVAEGDALSAEEPGDAKANPVLRIRMFALDFTKIASAAGLDGITRPSQFVTASADEIRAAKYTKPPAQNPLVVG